MAQDAGRAVGPDRPVPFGACLEAVDLSQVVEQHLAGEIHRDIEPIEVHVLAGAEVGPQPDQIPLVSHRVGQLELLEEALDRRVGLAHLLARLDGEAQVAAVAETETDHGMGDARRPPVDQKEVHAPQLGQVEGPVVVAHRVVGFGAVLAVADIVDSDVVVPDFGPGENRHIRLPVPIVGGRDQRPPCGEHRPEKDKEGAPRPPSFLPETRENEARGHQGEDRAGGRAQRLRQIGVINGQRAQAGQYGKAKKGRHSADSTNDAAHFIAVEDIPFISLLFFPIKRSGPDSPVSPEASDLGAAASRHGETGSR